jgi:putative hydrolase of the HAD superfamily
MILVFDLDDTLYNERTYVESGLNAVATFGERQFGWDRQESLQKMIRILDAQGRGAVFDEWLSGHGRFRKSLVKRCVDCYRQHMPSLQLDPHARLLLPQLSAYPLYLVTDGHKGVQERKIQALNIRPFFRRTLITHRFGIRNAKPSLYCFDRIRSAERCDWNRLVYIGDDPSKDFVGLNRAEGHTIRVLTGRHKDVVAAPGYDAQHRIAHLGELPSVLSTIARNPS